MLRGQQGDPGLRSVIPEFYHQAFCKLFCSRSDDLKVMDCGPGRLQGELPLIWKHQFLLSLTDTWKSGAVFDTNSCACCWALTQLLLASHCSGYAAAAVKSLQSCPTLFDPIDGSPPGSFAPGILQARILAWVAISSSNA